MPRDLTERLETAFELSLEVMRVFLRERPLRAEMFRPLSARIRPLRLLPAFVVAIVLAVDRVGDLVRSRLRFRLDRALLRVLALAPGILPSRIRPVGLLPDFAVTIVLAVGRVGDLVRSWLRFRID